MKIIRNSKKFMIGALAGLALLGGMIVPTPADAKLNISAGLGHTGGNNIRAWIQTDAHQGNLFIFLDVVNTNTGVKTYGNNRNVWGRAITWDVSGIFPTGRTAFSCQENRTTGQVIYLSTRR